MARLCHARFLRFLLIALRPIAGCNRGQQLEQLFDVGGFDEMGVEARVAGAASVFGLPPSRHRDHVANDFVDHDFAAVMAFGHDLVKLGDRH